MLFNVFAACVLAAAGAHAKSSKGKSTTLQLAIPDTAVRDSFYTINVTIDGQTFPLLLDTGSADILVASTECPTTSFDSGCYLLKDRLEITSGIDVVKNETFGSVVGAGQVLGNQSFTDVKFGSFNLSKLAVPLIYSAAETEFQNGSFAGILGVGQITVSREYHYFKEQPPINAMIKDGLLAKPLYSFTVPRYGDPASPKLGNFTLGAIEDVPAAKNVTYSNILPTQDYSSKTTKYAYQTWTQVIQGARMNGKNITIPQGGITQNKEFVAVMDTGGEKIFVGALFTHIAAAFKGDKMVIPDVELYFDCSVPQLLEFQINDQWIPIDPLDMIIPGAVKTVNGTEMCLAAIEAGNSAFGDSILGPQFFRNVFSVFDYVSTKVYSKPPRVGIAPLTDAAAAVKRYPNVYKNRLH